MPDLALPRALWRAVMRIDADAGIGELGHVGSANQDETGTPQARHHWRVDFSRRRIVKRARTGAGDLTLDVEKILDRDRNTRKARRRGPDFAEPIHRLGRFDRGFDVDVNERACP